MAVEGGIAYLGGLNGLCVVDVADPYHASLVGSAAVETNFGIAVAGSVVYALGFNRELSIIDCSVPYAPVLVGQRTISSFASDIEGRGTGPADCPCAETTGPEIYDL